MPWLVFGLWSQRVLCCCRCVHEPCVITTSCLLHSEKRTVRRLVLTLGGHVISEWTSDCTLVVMTSLSVTVKVFKINSFLSLKMICKGFYGKWFEQFITMQTRVGSTNGRIISQNAEILKFYFCISLESVTSSQGYVYVGYDLSLVYKVNSRWKSFNLFS